MAGFSTDCGKSRRKKHGLEKTGLPTLGLTADDAQTNRFIITDNSLVRDL